MASDVSKAGAHERAKILQKRILDAGHPTLNRDKSNATAKRFWQEIRTYLLKASDCGLIADTPTEVREKLVLSETNAGGGTHSIAVGSVRNFHRDRALPHFTRKVDGGWFDFQISVLETRSTLTVISYDFELRLPGGSPVEFVRFDLNPPEHDNETIGLRCHVHFGSDDDGHSVVAPIMTPFEALDIMVHGIMRTGRVRQVP